MNHFWSAAIKPILEAVDPEVIVEIGVDFGHNTRNILEMPGSRAVVHAIDPAPQPNVDRWLSAYPGRLVFHRDISLNVIPELPQFQVGLIDGDHNWYTVFNEFMLIAALAGNDPDRFPVLLFHDIGWPYGRRDLYYAHDRIPPAYRHPHARKGIKWGQSELAEDGGLNAQLENALREGGERNGVLTAIEDAVKQTPIEFDFIRIPAYFGLGILTPKARRAACPALSAVLDEVTSAAGLLRFLETVENDRAKLHIAQQEIGRELKRLQDEAQTQKPSLSVIVVAHNMTREARRTLHSLSREYQRGIDGLDYEVIVVDNGSTEPLGEGFVRQFGENFSYLYLENAPKSPARAINTGAARARGDVLCIMIDGAHVLTPGILRYAMKAFAIYANPVVASRYWFTGPGQQGETVQTGYDAQAEDRLFERIGWPDDGYRMFEIGVFITPLADWMSYFFESNCLFMRRAVFEAIGRANEDFDFPGGGFLNMDLMRQAAEQEGVALVTLLGEATFHQVHGGITTNVAPAERQEKVAMYREQYRRIRGREYQVPARPIEYLGHRPDFRREQLAFKEP
jgi:glycosyltransferase involved in cell wall biosynthesis